MVFIPTYHDGILAVDSRGNMTAIGTGTTPLNVCSDSSNRNWCLVNYTSSGNGDGMYYSRDVSGRTVYREHDDIANWNWTITDQYFYGFTGPGGSPDFTRNGNWDITEQYLSLPGGVLLTLKPQESQTNDKKQYSLSGKLGHTLLTTNAAGTNTSTGNGPANTLAYDPFGNPIPGNVLPANTANGSDGYGGANQRLTETSLALIPIQMGARVYLPTAGRFTSPDPIEGGTPNNYVYPVDPVDTQDFSGKVCMPSGPYPFDFFNCRNNKEFKQTAKTVIHSSVALNVVPTVAAGTVIVGMAAPEVLAPIAVNAIPLSTKINLGTRVMNSKRVGVVSKKFGNPTITNSRGLSRSTPGSLNMPGNWLRIGWSVGPTKAGLAPVFRISIFGKHIDIFFGRFYKP
jgi:RHS repeat-associated protein